MALRNRMAMVRPHLIRTDRGQATMGRVRGSAGSGRKGEYFGFLLGCRGRGSSIKLCIGELMKLLAAFVQRIPHHRRKTYASLKRCACTLTLQVYPALQAAQASNIGATGNDVFNRRATSRLEFFRCRLGQGRPFVEIEILHATAFRRGNVMLIPWSRFEHPHVKSTKGPSQYRSA